MTPRPAPSYRDLAAASQALAEWVAAALRRALEQDERASVALPGGSTPGLFLASLARQDLPWKRITLLPTDERFVPADHPRSNERMMLAALAPALQSGARWLSFAPAEVSSYLEASATTLSKAIAPLLPITVLVSGMGEDGHICSLFPGDERLRQSGLPPVIPAHPKGLEPRLTLSAETVLAARDKALLFGGSSKIRVMDEARGTQDVDHYPVALLLKPKREATLFLAP